MEEAFNKADTALIRNLACYMQQNFDGKGVPSLYQGELMLLQYWNGDYSDLLTTIGSDPINMASTDGLLRYSTLTSRLVETSRLFYDRLADEISRSDRTAEEKAFLKLWLYYLLEDDNWIVNADTVDRMAHGFLAAFPGSEYQKIATNNGMLIPDQVTNLIQMGIEGGIMMGQGVPGPSDNTRFRGIYCMSMDFYYRSLVLGFQAGGWDFHNPVSLVRDKYPDDPWLTGDDLHAMKVSIRSGWAFRKTRSSVSVASLNIGASLVSNQAISEDITEENSMTWFHVAPEISHTLLVFRSKDPWTFSAMGVTIKAGYLKTFAPAAASDLMMSGPYFTLGLGWVISAYY